MVIISHFKGGEEKVFDINSAWMEPVTYSNYGTKRIRKHFPFPHWQETQVNNPYDVFYLKATLTGCGKEVIIGKFELVMTAREELLKIADVMTNGEKSGALIPHSCPRNVYRVRSTHF